MVASLRNRNHQPCARTCFSPAKRASTDPVTPAKEVSVFVRSRLDTAATTNAPIVGGHGNDMAPHSVRPDAP